MSQISQINGYTIKASDVYDGVITEDKLEPTLKAKINKLLAFLGTPSNGLINKSDLATTNDSDGVIYTNNGDGSITVNGTPTEDFTYYFLIDKDNFFDPTHKYLLVGGAKGGGYEQTYMLTACNDVDTSDVGNGAIFTGRTNLQLIIYTWNKTPCNNLVFKPQIYDLTANGDDGLTLEQAMIKYGGD